MICVLVRSNDYLRCIELREACSLPVIFEDHAYRSEFTMGGWAILADVVLIGCD